MPPYPFYGPPPEYAITRDGKYAHFFQQLQIYIYGVSSTCSRYP
jgi:hypothetical protein